MDPKIEEFINLVKASGWTQAEVARQLHITPGAVSQICNGITRPRDATLNMFRMLIGPKRRQMFDHSRTRALEAAENQFFDTLHQLPRVEREKLLLAFMQTIRTLKSLMKR